MAAAKGKSTKATEQLISQERQRSTARKWKQRSLGHDLALPSGEVALVRTVGPEAFLTSGVIPDTLAPIVNEAIRNGQGLPPEKAKEMSDDMGALSDMVKMLDQVVMTSVLDPQIVPAPVCTVQRSGDDECGEPAFSQVHADKKNPNWHVAVIEERDDDTLYVDELSFEDKQFVFQYVMGGTKDLERFRRESDESVAAVSDGEDVAVPA